MKHRSTFSLDDLTIARIKRLSLQWKVSQAETVRRALEQAEQQSNSASQVLGRLADYHRKGGLSSNQANEWLEEVAEGRSDWGRGQ